MRKEYDYNKLKGRITEKFGSQRAFAKSLYKSDAYVTRYISGISQFTQSVISLWAESLQIEITEIGDFFFTYAVDKAKNKGET